MTFWENSNMNFLSEITLHQLTSHNRSQEYYIFTHEDHLRKFNLLRANIYVFKIKNFRVKLYCKVYVRRVSFNIYRIDNNNNKYFR